MHESARLVMLVGWSDVVDDVEEMGRVVVMVVEGVEVEIGVGETVVIVVKEGELQPLFAAETALDVKFH